MMTGMQEDIKRDNIKAEEAAESIKIEGVFNGLPYKGPMINLKHNDPDSKLPQLMKKLHVRRFDLNKEDDLLEYEKVCQSLTDGVSQLSTEKIEYVANNTNWIVLIRWVELWYGPPKEL